MMAWSCLAQSFFRIHSIMEALRRLHVPNSMGAPLFFFATREELRAADPLFHGWHDGNGREPRLN